MLGLDFIDLSTWHQRPQDRLRRFYQRITGEVAECHLSYSRVANIWTAKEAAFKAASNVIGGLSTFRPKDFKVLGSDEGVRVLHTPSVTAFRVMHWPYDGGIACVCVSDAWRGSWQFKALRCAIPEQHQMGRKLASTLVAEVTAGGAAGVHAHGSRPIVIGCARAFVSISHDGDVVAAVAGLTK